MITFISFLFKIKFDYSNDSKASFLFQKKKRK